MAIPVRKAAWRVTLDGTDLTSVLGPRLIMLTLEEKRGDEADQIDIEINDADGKVDLPPKGATLRVFMGWEKGGDVLTGLIDKGTFRIDEVRWISGADKIILRGRSADFTSAFRKRRDRSFVGKTVAEVIGTIAMANGLKAQVHPDLASKIVPPLGSGPRSDSALLKDLGKRFDATATVKAGNLLFSPIGKGQTASGITLPPETIARAACPPSGIDYERSERATYTGVEAQWHDKATAQRQTVVAGSDTNAKRLKKIYASESAALQAAEAEWGRTRRAGAKLTLPLSWGRPDIFPEKPITVTGFKPEINAQKWIVVSARHQMDGTGGSTTSLQLESA